MLSEHRECVPKYSSVLDIVALFIVINCIPVAAVLVVFIYLLQCHLVISFGPLCNRWTVKFFIVNHN